MNLQNYPHLARVVNTKCFGTNCQHMKSFQVTLSAYSLAKTQKNKTHLVLFLLELVCSCKYLKKGPKVLETFDTLCESAHKDALELFQVDTQTYYRSVHP